MATERRTLQDLIRARQRRSFIGRREQLMQFEANFDLPVDSDQRKYIFNIHGISGVGKTFLTRQLEQNATSKGAFTAYTAEDSADAITAMSAIAEQFAGHGVRLTNFTKRLEVYNRRRLELESDNRAPKGVTSFLTKTALGIALTAAVQGVPPLAGGLLSSIDPSAVADQFSQAQTYLVRKFGARSHDVQLMLWPMSELTKAFVSGLNIVASSSQIALFFDSYEATAPLLDAWLRKLYDGQYGDLPANMITVVSGQYPLSSGPWSDYRQFIADISLEPFTEPEALAYLASERIFHQPTVTKILALSGRLPMWLNAAATAGLHDDGVNSDLTGDIVSWILRSVQDPGYRDIAIRAATPRIFNRDVINVIATPRISRDEFAWLCGLSFVMQQRGTWKYHEAARSAMLRLRRAQSPAEWRADNLALASAYAEWDAEVMGLNAATYAQSQPNDYSLERAYHLLCVDSLSNLSSVVESAVKAAGDGDLGHAQHWIRMIMEAARDIDDKALERRASHLVEAISNDNAIAFFDLIIDIKNLTSDCLASAYCERGYRHLIIQYYDQALSDFDRAVELGSSDSRVFVGRAMTFMTTGRLTEASSDLDRAVELDSQLTSTRAYRGLVRLIIGRRDEAFADLDCAIEKDRDDISIRLMRGLARLMIGRIRDAADDFERIATLDPEIASANLFTAMAYLVIGRLDDAITALDRALGLKPDDGDLLTVRAMLLAFSGRLDEAIADLDRAMQTEPGNRVTAMLGEHLRQSKSIKSKDSPGHPRITVAPEAWLATMRDYLMSGMGFTGASSANLNATTAAGGPLPLATSHWSENVDKRQYSPISPEEIGNVRQQFFTGVISTALDQLAAGRPDLASDIFKGLLTFMPNNAIIHNNYAFCLLPSDPEGALRELLTAKNLGDDSIVGAANRMLALHLLHREDEALSIALPAVDQESGAWLWTCDKSHFLTFTNVTDLDTYLAALRDHISARHSDS
jgi:tetratricopeptide (TPR) repeat protein